jgi:hypothetical protein
LTVELSSIEKEHDVTESEDVDYYTKVYLLSFIHGPLPVGISTGRGKVFLSQDDVARLPERDHSRMEKDLPLADLLSLFMVASAEGDVASTCIHYSQLGRVTIFIAKNETSIADEIQMQRLLGLCLALQRLQRFCLGVTFVFSVIFAGCKFIGVCFPLKCDFWEFYGFAKGVCCGSRDCCARRSCRLTRMSVGLTLNGGTLVAQNRDERRDRYF